MNILINEKIARLSACEKIRNISSHTCLITLQHSLKNLRKVSELNFRNRWLKELEKEYFNGFVGCWYDPPPGGIGVLFGGYKNINRINYPTLRNKDFWPKLKIFFDKQGYGYLFASSFIFVENVPIIGDFGFTYYLGGNSKIKDHYRKCYKLQNSLIEGLTVGMKFKDVYGKASESIKNNSLENNVYSITDKRGTNIGHTIPFIDRNPSKKETESIQSGDEKLIHQIISEARTFINQEEEFEITDNCAFTFEPRLTSITDPTLPQYSFHTIIQFVKGEKLVLSNFNGVIHLLEMDWLF